MKSFPTLYGESKHGKTKEWTISVVFQEGQTSVWIITESGYTDGKKTLFQKEIKEGKNIGKANETTIYEQAISEAHSSWKDKIKRGGYTPKTKVEEVEEKVEEEDEEKEEGSSSSVSPSIMYPMLAQKWTSKKTIQIGNTFIQPKLDGVRCMMKYIPETKEVVCLSRSGQPYYHLTKIREAVKGLYSFMKKNGIQQSIWLDGELYKHGMAFQKITSIVRKQKEEDKASDELQYHIYDIYIENDPKMTFDKRYTYLQKLSNYHHPNLCWVDTQCITTSMTEDGLMDLHNMYVEKGYEGMMIRYGNGIYRPKYRSNELLKYKMFEDHEYTIEDYKESPGIPGTIQFICSYKDVKQGNKQLFTTDMKGPMEWRSMLYQTAKKNFVNGMKGKPLTVQHQGYTDMGAPRFPKGKGIRDYE
jgi:DNA ligase-1